MRNRSSLENMFFPVKVVKVGITVREVHDRIMKGGLQRQRWRLQGRNF